MLSDKTPDEDKEEEVVSPPPPHPEMSVMRVNDRMIPISV